MMSAQNTHHIPACEHVFDSFHIVIRAVIVVYLILDFLCTSGEKGGIWRLCGDLKRRLEESSASTSRHSNVAMFSRRDVPTSRC